MMINSFNRKSTFIVMAFLILASLTSVSVTSCLMTIVSSALNLIDKRQAC